MKIKVQIPTKGHHPAKSGWYDTDKGNIYWFLGEEEWSCRDDRISNEYPDWWLEDLANVPQANELLPDVINWVAIIDQMPPKHKYVLLATKTGDIKHEFVHEFDLTTERYTRNYTHWAHEPKPPCL